MLDSRQSKRLPVSLPGRVATRNGEICATVIDISEGGAGVQTSVHCIGVGDRATLITSDFRAAGTVAWVTMQKIGLRFDMPLRRQVVEKLGGGIVATARARREQAARQPA